MPESDSLVGKVFAGRYRVDELIGQGGMGRVYRAVHLTMDKPVALKVLVPELAADPDSADRFEREAAASAKLRHPNTIQIFDYGTSEEGQLFLAMELLQGHTLGACIARDGPLSPSRAVHIAVQVLKSLKEAHAQGIIHRDLKPENIFLADYSGEPDFVKVLDFGIARFVESDRIKETLTRAGAMCGTPMYVAPEQGLGYRATSATDIYSLGIILHEMLVGIPPFMAEDAVTMIMMQVHMPPPPLPEEVRGTLPDGLEELLVRMLDKAPGRRPAGAADVLRALTALENLSSLAPVANSTDHPGLRETEEGLSHGDPPQESAGASAPGEDSPPPPTDDQSREEVATLLVERDRPPPLPAARKMPVALVDLVTVLGIVAVVASGAVLWWLWEGSNRAERQQTQPVGAESAAAPLAPHESFDECISRCLKEGCPGERDGRIALISQPTRHECEEHCQKE